ELLVACQADLTNLNEARDLAREICRDTAIDHLVHNAGMILPNLLADAKAEDILTLAQLHLGAPMVLTQAALVGMRERGFGRIVFVSSRASMGMPTRSAYAATQGRRARHGADLGAGVGVRRHYRECRSTRPDPDGQFLERRAK